VTEDEERRAAMPTLPPDFADLEPFAGWALPTEGERYTRRLASTMDELQAFYDAAFPRLDEVLDYLDQFPLAEIPDDARNLLWLCSSLVTVSFPVEVWRLQLRLRRRAEALTHAAPPGTAAADAPAQRAAARRRVRRARRTRGPAGRW
jgi:hypothetical protein